MDYHLHIDGELEGVAHSKSTVVIGQTGSVVGEIFANKLVVSGKFTGTVEAEVVEIMPLGRLDGKISSQELVVERKGILIGETRPKNLQGGALLINEQEKKIENK
ncbi:polymer-forming cytoskeletal protein [Helicobacter pylori]|uniref:polymer-forming cytoskeletal protein n=1 Tax=Helicobacter pylori TaxID=210 RepID=UPI001F2C646D|nr:polymer-forming cytoskeletal protein [Helicobacter pylori]